MRYVWWSVGVLCLLASTLWAEATPIQNPGFEHSLASWTPTDSSVVRTPGRIYRVAPQQGTAQALLSTRGEGILPQPTEVNSLLGTNFAITSGSGSFVLASALRQTVTVTTGAPLRLLFDWDFLTQEAPSPLTSMNSGRDGAFVTIEFTGDGVPDILVFLAEIQPDTDGGGIGLVSLPLPFEDPPLLPPYTLHTGYKTYISDEFIPATTTITLGLGVADRLNNFRQAGQPSGLLLDNFRLQGATPTPIPEPGTLLLLGSGLLSVALWQRRARK